MLFIQEKDGIGLSRWYQLTEIVLYPEVSSILVTAYGIVDPNETFAVLNIDTKVVHTEEVKNEFEKVKADRVAKGYKNVEDSRFKAIFK